MDGDRGVLGYRWHLRVRMAEQGMYATTDLGPRLAERGVILSAAQVYRLVTGTPERLSLQTLSALCDILGCAPNDLIEPTRTAASAPVTAVAGTRSPDRRTPDGPRRPRRADIRRTP